MDIRKSVRVDNEKVRNNINRMISIIISSLLEIIYKFILNKCKK